MSVRMSVCMSTIIEKISNQLYDHSFDPHDPNMSTWDPHMALRGRGVAEGEKGVSKGAWPRGCGSKGFQNFKNLFSSKF